MIHEGDEPDAICHLVDVGLLSGARLLSQGVHSGWPG